MSSTIKQTPLSRLVHETTTVCPRIVGATARAVYAHGLSPAERLEQLRLAQGLARLLAEQLELAEREIAEGG